MCNGNGTATTPPRACSRFIHPPSGPNSLVPLTVNLQGKPYSCIQYNSGSTPVVQATSLTNTLVVQAAVGHRGTPGRRMRI